MVSLYGALQIQESSGSFTWWRHRILRHCCQRLAKRYICTISVNTLPRQLTSNDNWANKRKCFHIKKKNKKQMIPCRNYDIHRLRRWSRASYKYTSPSITYSQQHETLAFLWIIRKQSSCVLNKKESFLKLVDQFTYLGSNISSTESNVNIDLVKAWTAIDRLTTIWKSDLSNIKWDFFQAVAVTMLLYGFIWTLTKQIAKKLDGNYVRMPHAVLSKSWKQHPTKQRRCSHLSPITQTIQVRQIRHAEHIWRSKDTRKWHSFMESNSWTYQHWPTSKDLHTSLYKLKIVQISF